VLRLVDLPTLKPVKPKTIDLGAAGGFQHVRVTVFGDSA